MTILGVDTSYTSEELKKKYRRLASKLHPDVAGEGGEVQFKELSEAYNLLLQKKVVVRPSFMHSGIFTIVMR
jgi:molecular chaperone DnaJ